MTVYNNYKEEYYIRRRRRAEAKKRAAIRRQRFMTRLLVISMIILTIGLFCGFNNLYAGETSPAPETYKYFTGITVQSGDTLTSIAGKYITNEYRTVEDYIDEVKYINNLDSDKIVAGRLLVVPYYSVIKK